MVTFLWLVCWGKSCSLLSKSCHIYSHPWKLSPFFHPSVPLPTNPVLYSLDTTHFAAVPDCLGNQLAQLWSTWSECVLPGKEKVCSLIPHTTSLGCAHHDARRKSGWLPGQFSSLANTQWWELPNISNLFFQACVGCSPFLKHTQSLPGNVCPHVEILDNYQLVASGFA